MEKKEQKYEMIIEKEQRKKWNYKVEKNLKKTISLHRT